MITKILANSAKSKSSTNVNNIENISIEQNARILPYSGFNGTLDIYSLFEDERAASNKYRLIFTINPILTNVLFNVNTEIVRGEGGENPELIDNRIRVSDGYDEETDEDIKIYGDKTPDRLKMVQNTEYSRKGLDYVYNCGYDIFNNHLFRNKSFKSVNMPNKYGETDFNTIRDLMRYNDGTNVLYNKRIDVKSKPEMDLKRHLYDYEDVRTIDESINDNLIEENGWFGFTNTSNINTKEVGAVKNGSIYLNNMNINLPMNNLKACDFVDMYPDRTLFSFTPKVNSILNRLEYNWHYCLTYPYKNLYDHVLIQGNGVNGLKCQYIMKQNGFRGNNTFLFRMLLPHNLSVDDEFYLYKDGEKLGSPLTVAGVGDLKGKNKKYVFYVYGNEIQERLGLTGDTYDSDLDALNLAMNGSEFRIRRIYGGFESEYYIRMFRRLPNFRYAKELTSDTVVGENEDGTKKTITDEVVADLMARKKTEFDNELYQLGFQRTIFNDNCVQVTFTDTVDIDSLRDNLGRPLSEIYLTIVKNNKGWETWYGDTTLPGLTPTSCSISYGTYNKTVPVSGATVKIPIYAKNDLGDSIQWEASNGQTGNDGDNLVVVIPPCDKTENEGGCQIDPITVKPVSDTLDCGSVSVEITFEQESKEEEVEECNSCKPRFHTDMNIHSLDHLARTATFYVYYSCYKDNPYPWEISVIDRETGKAATWATVSPSSGTGYCCTEWDNCLAYQDPNWETIKANCIKSTPEKFILTLTKNESNKSRTADITIKTIGGCVESSTDYITQAADPDYDGCPKKYAMFKNARTVTNVSNTGLTLNEPLNIYCKEGDVVLTKDSFEITGIDASLMTITGSGSNWSFKIPENESTSSRTITITVHPNIDDVSGTKSLSLFFNTNPVYKDGVLYSDYTDNEIGINYRLNSGNDINIKSETSVRNNETETFIPNVTNGNITPRDMKETEYSHCFGVVTSGFKIFQHLSVPQKGVQQPETDIMESDVKLLHNIENYKIQSSRYLEYDIKVNGSKNSTVTNEINNYNDLFLGDVVDFNIAEAKETILDSVYHRFNTNQREHDFSKDNPSSTFTQFHWDDFISDDYDPDGFKVTSTATTVSDRSNLRAEGYYYKPHYRVALREVSDKVSQESAIKLSVEKTEKYGNNLIKLTTNQRHNLKEGDVVHITVLDENKNDKEDYISAVFNVIDDLTLILVFDEATIGFGELSSGLLNGNIEARRFKTEIPYYAFSLKDGTGRYVWRYINRIGDLSNSKLKEEDYPFTNGCFYHHTNIVFFLQRQDPHNEYGIYNSDKFPNDVMGDNKPTNNYEYINPEEIIC